jgi:hypothetical protein
MSGGRSPRIGRLRDSRHGTRSGVAAADGNGGPPTVPGRRALGVEFCSAAAMIVASCGETIGAGMAEAYILGGVRTPFACIGSSQGVALVVENPHYRP